jgi:hypothetical protein
MLSAVPTSMVSLLLKNRMFIPNHFEDMPHRKETSEVESTSECEYGYLSLRGAVIRLQAGWSWVRVLAAARDFSLLQNA